MLAAEPDGQKEAGAKRSDDGAERVRRVRAPDHSRRILAARGERCQRQRKAGAPEDGRGQDREQAPDEIELKLKPGIGRDRGVDRPIRQRRVQNVCGPGHPRAQQQLAPGERHARAGEARPEHRADAAAEAKAGEKDRQDQRERIGRGAEQQRQRARPQHFGRQRRQPGQGEDQVHDPTIAHGRHWRGKRVRPADTALSSRPPAR